MGLLNKIKNAGSALKDASETYLEYTAAGAKDMVPTTGTLKGAAHGDIGDIAKIGVAAATVYGGARLARSATTLRAGASEARLLEFPDAAPERSLAGRVKNALNDKRAVDKAQTAFTAQRNQELPGKIAAVKSEINRLDSIKDAGASVRREASGFKVVPKGVNPGERGALRFPAGSPEKIQKAHANVPEGQFLFTAEAGGPEGETFAYTKNAPNKGMERRSTAAANPTSVALMDRAVNDVRSGRAKLAGFYEKIHKDENGWIRVKERPTVKTPSGMVSKAHTEFKFGEGTHPGDSALGMGPDQKGYYRAVVRGGSKPNSIKIDFLEKKGNPGNVEREMSALGKGLKARGIDTIEHEPLTKSRSRLFARQLRKSGFKNADKGAPDISRRDPNYREMAAGWKTR